MSRWPLLRLCLLALLALLAACHSASYAPVEPRRTATPPARLRLAHVRVERRGFAWSFEATLEGSAANPFAPVEVFLSSAYADGCDGEPAFVSPHPRGLTAYVSHVSERTFLGPTTLDVLVAPTPGGSECLRVPLAHGGPDAQLRATGRDEWLLSARANVELTSSPVTASILSLTLGAGTWVGPLRTSLSTGVASAFCSSDSCASEEDRDGRKQQPSGLALPIDLAFEGFVWSGRKRAVSLALRPGFRLSFVRAAHPLPRRAAFTPALVLGYWVVPEQGLAAYATPQRVEGGGMAFELPIGVWQDLDQGRPTGFFMGLSGALMMPVD